MIVILIWKIKAIFVIKSRMKQLKYDYSIYNGNFSIFQRTVYIVISGIGFERNTSSGWKI